MSALLKYATFLALALAIGFFVYDTFSLEDISSVPARQEAVAAPVDPGASGSIYEELDYRVAQRLGSLEGWRAFLAANGSGVHAQSARAEVEKLLAAEEAQGPPAAESSNGQSPDATAAIELDPAPSAVATEVAPPTPDEVCKREGDRFAQLHSNPSSDEARRFANELGCEKLRPQVLGLIEGSDHAVPAPAAAEVLNGASAHAKTATEAARRRPRHADMEEEALAPAAAPGETERRESAGFDTRTVNGTNQDVCRRERAELNRIRATRDLGDAKRFASAVTCDELKPQAMRLLKRLTE